MIEQHIKLAELPRRKSTKLVKDLFGIDSLAGQDIRITLNLQETEVDISSDDANARFKRALPYLYAIRLGRKLDEDNRERNSLANAELCLCTKISASATLPDGEFRKIELSSQGDRLLLEQTLFIVDHFEKDAPSLVRFWQGVANLVAELLGTDVAAEAANVFRCRTPLEMEEVVLELVDDEPRGKLALARERLTTEIELDDEPPHELLPPRAEVGAGKHEQTDDAHPAGGSTDKPPLETPGASEATFVPTDPPASRTRTRRKIVITRAPIGTPRSRNGPIATEDVTFEIVEAFELQEGRYPIRVSHMHGSHGFGCDILSLESDEAVRIALESGKVSDNAILRFIEVKGRSSRTDQIELTENEFERAEIEGARYFLYRVFRDSADTSHFELGILADPVNSSAIRQVTRFDLSEGSGAQWFLLLHGEHDTTPSV